MKHEIRKDGELIATIETHGDAVVVVHEPAISDNQPTPPSIAPKPNMEIYAIKGKRNGVEEEYPVGPIAADGFGYTNFLMREAEPTEEKSRYKFKKGDRVRVTNLNASGYVKNGAIGTILNEDDTMIEFDDCDMVGPRWHYCMVKNGGVGISVHESFLELILDQLEVTEEKTKNEN